MQISTIKYFLASIPYGILVAIIVLVLVKNISFISSGNIETIVVMFIFLFYSVGFITLFVKDKDPSLGKKIIKGLIFFAGSFIGSLIYSQIDFFINGSFVL